MSPSPDRVQTPEEISKKPVSSRSAQARENPSGPSSRPRSPASPGHHPDLGYAALGNSGGSSSSGAFWGCKQPGGLEEPWDGSLGGGGGSGLDGDPNEAPVYPAAYRLELSINGETETLTLTLTPREGGAA